MVFTLAALAVILAVRVLATVWAIKQWICKDALGGH